MVFCGAVLHYNEPKPGEASCKLHLPKYYILLLTMPQLFYNKRSQFVFGVEDEKVPVCTGKTVNTNQVIIVIIK